LFRVVGQPNLNLVVDRRQAARYQLNVADVQDAVQTAVGGAAFGQVLQGEQRYDLVMRYLPQYRDSKEAIERIRLASPTGERVSLAQLCAVQVSDGANEIYREGNSRYIAIKYSVRGRDLGSTVEEAIRKTSARVRRSRWLSHRMGLGIRKPTAFATTTRSRPAADHSRHRDDPLSGPLDGCERIQSPHLDS
jgi:cobalt-zinc-cadmium resistance protein CzcA